MKGSKPFFFEKKNQKTFFKRVPGRHPMSTRDYPNSSLRGGEAAEGIHLSLSFREKMDCFAALAMTAKAGG
jgi:hypothetical protein